MTYFEGDPENGLEPDLEARQHWLDVGVAESHVIPGNAKDNFWGTNRPTVVSALFKRVAEMGSTGPCGPSRYRFEL